MVSRPVVRRATLLAVAGMAVAALVAGCGSAQTATVDTVTSGVDAEQGDIQVRNARIAAPVGGGRWATGATVPVTMHLINSGDVRDRLVRATSPVADAVRVVRASPSPSGSATATPSGTASPSDTPPPPASAAPTVSPSPPPSAGTASPDPDRVPDNPQTTAPVASPSGPSSPSPSASASAGQDLPLPLEPTTLVTLDGGEVRLLLVDLTRDLSIGELVEVTLEFERAGRLTLRLPVATPDSPLPRASLTHGEGEEHGE